MSELLTITRKFTTTKGQTGLWTIEGWLEMVDGVRRFQPYRACPVGSEEALDAWTGFDEDEPEAWGAFAEGFIDDRGSEDPPQPWDSTELLKVLTPIAEERRSFVKALRFAQTMAAQGIGPQSIPGFVPMEAPVSDDTLAAVGITPIASVDYSQVERRLLAYVQESHATVRAAQGMERVNVALQNAGENFLTRYQRLARHLMREGARIRVPVTIPAEFLRVVAGGEAAESEDPAATERAADRQMILRVLEQLDAVEQLGDASLEPDTDTLLNFYRAVRRFVAGTPE